MKMIASVLTLAGLALVAAPAQACHWCHTSFSCARAAVCCAPAPVTYVDKVVTCYKPEWKEREIKVVVNKVVKKEVVETVKCTVMEPEYKDVKRIDTVYKRVAHEVEKEVTKCHRVKECCVDECGRCYTVRYWEPVTTKVKCVVYDRVPEKIERTVKVCTYKPVEKSYDVKRIVCELKPETVVRKEKYCEMVSYQKTIKVPVCN
jgi:hypothetical protein